MFSKLSAEFIGTFWLVLGGCGSAVLAAGFPDVGIGLRLEMSNGSNRITTSVVQSVTIDPPPASQIC